ncbi:MAG: phospholipase C, phosphocholine-specific [Niastella sp.]|nr:phospholipase C, phosphocholine-specific [Niastella sp.]
MDTRREFLKKAIMVSGATGMASVIPPSIQRALAINPAAGSTYLDAEHIVILMQENRSFDHCFGSLRGVRGFNDPRAIRLPNENLVWLQTNKDGDTYTAFHFDIKDTKITWMGSVPHSRSSQVDAYNDGRYDKWLDSKRSGNKKYAHMPLTLGHYTRSDLPFHYAMADAFTICDQHFSSAMTSTWPNRLYLWGGTIRQEKDIDAKAFIRNNIPWGEATWKTFPELLEENDISWKVYQNELSNGGGFAGEEKAWLDNFGCNPMEQQAQFNSRFSSRYVNGLRTRIEKLQKELNTLETQLAAITEADKDFEKIKKEIVKKNEVLFDAQGQLVLWGTENFENLSARQKNLFQKAFTTNIGDPDYLSLSSLSYEDHGEQREVLIPKGDVLSQFRKDADTGNLPTVSWIVPSQNLSDHPSAPWYGTWYTSEILDILTKNPEVWKKTIFILTYDENDGYFDHVPPFTAPDYRDPGTGKCSDGVNANGVEYIKLENELAEGIKKNEARGGPIGLGFRVPMIIASPWSRGGKVCSQVLDHTSSIQFLEDFLNKKYKKKIKQTNISEWRRTICGNLVNVFSLYRGEKTGALPFLSKDPLIEKIYNAKFQNEPVGFKKLNTEEILQINKAPTSSVYLPQQEPGIRVACPLPYQLYADATFNNQKKSIVITMHAGNEIFGNNSAGSPFTVYAIGNYTAKGGNTNSKYAEPRRVWQFAVKAGDSVMYEWPLQDFENENYHLRLYGPNGFFREFAGTKNDLALVLKCDYQRSRVLKSKLNGNIALQIHNNDTDNAALIKIVDNAYHANTKMITVGASGNETINLNLEKSFGWYDFTVFIKGRETYIRRYAGKVEAGKESYSDPAMGNMKM